MDDDTIRQQLYDLPRLLAFRAALRRVEAATGPRAEVVFGASSERGRVGLLPGSFNPLTVAHLALAQAGLRSGAADAVFLTLSSRTVDKEVVTGAALEDRLLVLELACRADARLGGLLANRGLYVELAELARTTFPDAAEIVFLVGFDKIVQIFDPRYYEDREAALERLFGLACFLVAPRAGRGAADLARLLDRPENRPFADAVRPLDLPPDLRNVASSQVRQRIASGALPADALPAEARVFVDECGAYDGRAPDAPGVDRYRLRLSLLDALEVASRATDAGVDFRALFDQARGRESFGD